MVQTERETGALRGQFARQAAVQASAAAQAESARAQAEQLSRKLAAARAEVRRYQTRMFAFERTLLALKHENAELEAACEQAREQLEQANARAEQAEAACRRAEAALAAMQQTAPEVPVQPDTAPRPCRNARLHRNSLYRRRKRLSVPRNRRCPRSPHSLHGSRRPGWSRWLRS